MKNKLIVALDVDNVERAKRLVFKLSPYVNTFKVGSQLFTLAGPEIIKYIQKKKRRVFLDLKFFDIPNTVEKAVISASRHKACMLTIHTTGGYEMMRKAALSVKDRTRRPLIIGVTVLTSMAVKDAEKEVVRLAKEAKRAGLDGVVCSPKETRAVKEACGKNFLVVNPGVRPLWASQDDQKRTTTPREAIDNGADFIVVGRPITKVKDQASAARKILVEIIG